MYLLDRDWFRTVPTKLSLIPFDSEAYRVDRDGDLFKQELWTLDFLPTDRPNYF